MGVFDLFPADPNIDSPFKFVKYVIILVIGIALIVGGIRIFVSMSSSNKNPSSTASSTNTTTGTNTSGAVQSETKSTPTKGTASKAGITVPVTYDIIINYTDQGFNPATIQIKAGTSVRFINKSGGTMRVASVKNEASASDFTDLNQSQSLGKGGTYDFTFTRKGTWLYENLNNPTKTGVVVVN